MEPTEHKRERARPRRKPATMAMCFFVSSLLHGGLWATAMVTGTDSADYELYAGTGEGGERGEGGEGGEELPMFTVKLHEPRETQVTAVLDPTPAPDVVEPEPEPEIVATERVPPPIETAPEPMVQVDEAPPEELPPPEPPPVSASVSGPPAADVEPAALDPRVSEEDDEAARRLAAGGFTHARPRASNAPAITGEPSGSSAPASSGATGSDAERGEHADTGVVRDESDAQAGAVGRPGAGASEGILLYGPHPAYPSQSIRRREEGRVACVLHVDVEGRVRRVEITQSSGHARLDRAAVDTLSRWRFRPALRGGQPTPFTFSHTVRFVLE